MPSNHLILCVPFSSCFQSFPASGSFPMSWLFTSGGQSIGASASAKALLMNIQDWFPLGLTGLQSNGLFKSLLQHHNSKASIHWRSAFFMAQLSHPHMATGKTIALTIWLRLYYLFILSMENIKCYKIITTKEALVPLELTCLGWIVSQNSLPWIFPVWVGRKRYFCVGFGMQKWGSSPFVWQILDDRNVHCLDCVMMSRVIHMSKLIQLCILICDI